MKYDVTFHQGKDPRGKRILIDADNLDEAKEKALHKIESEFGILTQDIRLLDFYKANSEKEYGVYTDKWLLRCI